MCRKIRKNLREIQKLRGNGKSNEKYDPEL